MEANIEPLSAIRTLAIATAVLEDAQKAQTQAVIDARAAGASWAKIGAVLGMKKQSAQQKYRHATPATTSADTGNSYDDVPLSDPAFDVLFQAPQEHTK